MAIKFLNTVQVDTDVLYVDASSNRVGIGTTTPSTDLEVSSTGVNGVDISQSASNSSQSGRLFFTTNTASEGFALFNSNGTFQINSGGIPNNTSGTNRISIIGSSGNVGIGTTSPQKKLDISGGDIRLDNSKSIFFASTDANIGRVSIAGDEASDFIRLKVDNSNSHVINLNTTGVGIGTTSPATKLHISDATTPEVRIQDTTNNRYLSLYQNDSNSYIQSSLNSALVLSTHGANERMRITTAGNVGIGTTSPDSKLHIYANNADAPTVVKIENGDVGVVAGQDLSKIEFLTNDASAPGAGVAASIRTVCQNAGNIFDLAFNTQNGPTRTERMRLDGAGNLGIGTTSPSYKLDVSGEGRFTGDLRCLSLIQTSQRDQKENINDIDKSKAKAIPFKEYTYKSSIDSPSRKRYGVVVEDIEDDYPELVHTDADGVKGVNYIDLLVKRVAELEKELEDISLTPGANGADGTNGTNGSPGAKGATGSAGSNGKNGSDGNSHLSNITSIGINGKSGQLEIVIGTSTYKFNPDK